MKIKSYIESVEYQKLNTKSCFVVKGWCFSCDNEEITWKIIVNDIERKYKVHSICRSDVMKKMQKYHAQVECGFCLYTEIEPTEVPENVRLVAKTKNENKTILRLNKRKIDAVKVTSDINCMFDYVEAKKVGKTVQYRIGGWAYSGNGFENVEYSVNKKNGEKMEITVQRIQREDLCKLGYVDELQRYCGFVVAFLGDAEEEYIFEIADAEGKICHRINYRQIQKTNIKKSILIILKNILLNFNMKNIGKGFTYLKKYGLRKLFKRMEKGLQTSELSYAEWYEMHKPSEEELESQREHKFIYEPKISIVVPTYNTPIKFLREMIDSVCEQTYGNWELCIADGSAGNQELEFVLKEYANADERIKYKILKKNYGIAENTNGALQLATGDYVGLFDHDDLLTPNCLYEVVKALQDDKYDILYTDEDKVNVNLTEYTDPNFKPDWSPDLFYSHNYITHFFVVKKQIIDSIGGFRSDYDGSQDYDLMFRCIENAKSIKHIPMILYHWRIHAASVAGDPSSKMYAYDAGKRAIEGHFERAGIKAKVEHMPLWGMYHAVYETTGNPLISILIPNKDHIEDLTACIKSLYEVNTYQNFEIIVIENNSVRKETFEFYDKLEKEHDNITVVTWKEEFNYAAINNFGVTFAKGNYLLFLNNDTEVINAEAVEELLGCCMRTDVGIVGAKLLYADDTVQHAGIVLGFGGFAGHVFTGIDKDDYGYMVRPRINCNYSAVTAACMMVDKKIFEEVGGFSEEFKVGLNDVDFCLKVRAKGSLVVYNAHSLWHHYESKSRGYEDTTEKIQRFEGEIALFQKYWGKVLDKGDPYYNKNFLVEYGPFKLG